MRKFIVLTALLALFAVPAFAAGHAKGGGNDISAKEAVAACKAEREADPAAFKAKYANKKGHKASRRCIRRHVRQAKQTCRAERKADPAAFKAKYGNEKGHRAFRRCVRQHEADPVS